MTSKYAGRSTASYRNARKQLKAARQLCYHCGQPIDWAKPWPHPDSFSADHLLSRRDHIDLADDPANLVTSHLRCNQSKGAGEAKLGLGNRSEEF